MKTHFLLLALAACGHPDDEAAPPEPDLSDRVTWTSAEVPGELVIATLPAEVVSATEGAWRLGPAVDGRIVAWHVAPGQRVDAGTPLADLVSPELATLQARASALASRVTEQEGIVAVRERAAAAGVASSAELTAARADLSGVRGELASVQRELTAHRDTMTGEGGLWRWRAPSDGTVASVDCGLDVVEPSDRCLTLVDPELAVLEVPVPERLLATVGDGVARAVFHAADGTTHAYVESGRSPEVSPSTRARRFRFTPSAGGPLPGSAGRADLVVDAPPGAVRVPPHALTRVDDAPTVFVRDGDTGRPVRVEPIGRSDGGVVVHGLAPDAEVAVRGVFLLKSLSLLEEGA